MGCLVKRQQNEMNFVAFRLANSVDKNDSDYEFCEVIASAPENLIISASDLDSISLQWDATAVTYTYSIERKLSSESSYTVIGTTTSNTYDDTGLDLRTSYDYRVRISSPSISDYSYVSGTTYGIVLDFDSNDIIGMGDVLSSTWNQEGINLGTDGTNITFTFGMWINFKSVAPPTSTNPRTLLQTREQDQSQSLSLLFYEFDNDYRIEFITVNSSTNTISYVLPTIDSDWHFLSCRLESETAYINLDGVDVASGAYVDSGVPSLFPNGLYILPRDYKINEVFWTRDTAIGATDLLSCYNDGRNSNYISDNFSPYMHFKFDRTDVIPDGDNTSLGLTAMVSDSEGNSNDLNGNNFALIGSTSNWIE